MSFLGMRLTDLKNPRIRTLHFAWMACFVSFLVWFSHAPLMIYIKQSLGLTDQEVMAILTLNVVLTIPARILVGMLVDRWGPRAVYALLLLVSSVLCFWVALAQNFEQMALARFALGVTGAGFVIGIRLVGEWFPAREVGLAEGIYGGWGNFGAAAAALVLPSVALLAGGEDGWRWAMTLTGLVALFYSGIFYRSVRNTPKGSTYFKPRKNGGLEVTSRNDFFFYLAMNAPMYGVLGLMVWEFSGPSIGLLSEAAAQALILGITVLFGLHARQIHRVNREMLNEGVAEIYRYKFKQVAILDLAYMVTFGSELAINSVLPLFYFTTFDGVTPIQAGILASAFACMNLVARPAGGWLSDRLGRRRILSLLVAGLCVGHLTLSQVSGEWPIALAVLATMVCAAFGQAGSGAVFATVPLVRRRMTGQIAGMAGAYGNVGGVLFLTVYSFTDSSTFFMIVAASAAVALLVIRFMDEPQGHLAEVREDGTVELIEVA